MATGRGAVAPAIVWQRRLLPRTEASWCPRSSPKRSFNLSLGEDSLLPLTDNVEITGNTMAFPKDETTPWGSNGIRAYWQGEASSAVAHQAGAGPSRRCGSKSSWRWCLTTDELLEDTNALTSYLPDKDRRRRSAGRPTSRSCSATGSWLCPSVRMTAGATVTVAKESGQATQTLLGRRTWPR